MTKIRTLAVFVLKFVIKEKTMAQSVMTPISISIMAMAMRILWRSINMLSIWWKAKSKAQALWWRLVEPVLLRSHIFMWELRRNIATKPKAEALWRSRMEPAGVEPAASCMPCPDAFYIKIKVIGIPTPINTYLKTMEPAGVEPAASCMPCKRSPNWAMAPF